MKGHTTSSDYYEARIAELEAEVSRLRGRDMAFIKLLGVIREFRPHSIHGPLMATDAFKQADAAFLPTPQADDH